MANTCWTGGGQTSSKLGAAPVSKRIGPAFGWSIRVAMIATLRRGEVGLGFEGVLTPAAASAHPSSYSMLPRSRKCTFTVVPPPLEASSGRRPEDWSSLPVRRHLSKILLMVGSEYESTLSRQEV